VTAAAHPGLAAPSEWSESSPRFEIKFEGPGPLAGRMEALLRARCAADPAFPENEVHSIYFDTRRLAAYEDKAAGQYVKEKVRLRWYVPGDGHAWLEIKTRTGSRGGKRRKRVSFEAAEAVDERALAALLLEHLGSVYPPAVWLSYRRLRFVTPDGAARVALDRDIAVRWASSALPPRRPPGTLPMFVVEVKGDDPQPVGWLSSTIGRFARRTAFSKYALCVEHIRGGSS
jgi:hypothetical protein